jgi:glycosyltransferase involved in cell wall biosynthesis
MKRPHDLSVVHISPGKYHPLDRGHVTYGIWRELASGFGDYHVIARSSAGPAEWSDGNLHVTLVKSRFGREAEFLFTQLGQVGRMMRAKADVIVCQSPALGGVAALQVARRSGARTLMELHGMEFFARARFGSRLWLLQRMSRYALNRADRIRVLSPGMQQALARIYGRHLLARTTILPPRVNTSQFAGKRQSPAASGSLRIAMVGAVNANKGQLRLIRALRSSPFPIELHLAGDGPELLACQEAAQSLAAGGSLLAVRIHGRLAHSDVAELLEKCDLLVLYSRTEATPRAIMEAMACGLPVVTTNAGFCADIIEDGAEGFVIGPNPDKDVIEVLRRFNDDRSLISRMGAAAQERARRNYDSVRLFDEYRRLITETASA